MDSEEIKKITEKLKEDREKYKNDHEFRKNFWTDYLEAHKEKFTKESIPEPPIVDEDIYRDIIIPGWIERGAIPKSKLKTGRTYIGQCRNSHEAIWNGSNFQYTRNKFNSEYIEEIEHFEDYQEEDVFVPIREKRVYNLKHTYHAAEKS